MLINSVLVVEEAVGNSLETRASANVFWYLELKCFWFLFQKELDELKWLLTGGRLVS